MPNFQKFREPIMAPSFQLTDGTVLGGGGGATPAVEAVAVAPFTIVDTPVAVQRLRITFDAYQFNILAAVDYASVKLAEMGSRYLSMGVQSELDFVKDNTGVLNTAALDVAMSSAAATTANLTTFSNSDVMTKLDINGTGDHLDEAFNSFTVLSGTTVTGYPKATINTGLYLTIQTSILADGFLTLTGWIDLYYIDLGVAA
tara:strand:+ start:13945 stop:14547 length:603 start_codon:yes stop_codon:yes gene_type:complete